MRARTSPLMSLGIVLLALAIILVCTVGGVWKMVVDSQSSSSTKIPSVQSAGGTSTLTAADVTEELRTSSPTSTRTPFPTHTESPTFTLTLTVTPTLTHTPTVTPSPTDTPAPSSTPTPLPTSRCTRWDLVNDFRIAPDQENPNPDSCGYKDVWYFMGGLDLNRKPEMYSLLENFQTNAYDINGLERWQGDEHSESGLLPWIGINTTNQSQYLIRGAPADAIWHPTSVVVHPFQTKLVIVGWHSPVVGRVSINGSLKSIQNCGDGIAWYIDQNYKNIGHGMLPAGGAKSFRNDTTVNRGDFIYLVIHPQQDLYCDAIQVEIVIAR